MVYIPFVGEVGKLARTHRARTTRRKVILSGCQLASERDKRRVATPGYLFEFAAEGWRKYWPFLALHFPRHISTSSLVSVVRDHLYFLPSIARQNVVWLTLQHHRCLSSPLISSMPWTERSRSKGLWDFVYQSICITIILWQDCLQARTILDWPGSGFSLVK